MKFLEDSHKYFETFGYCWCDKNERLPADSRAYIVNWIVSFLLIWIGAISIEFIFNNGNPRNDRLFVVITFLGYFELDGAHFTLTFQKTKLYNFFEKFQSVISKRCRRNQVATQFYETAENKTKSVKRYALIMALCSYEAMMTVSAAYTIIVRIIIEKCESDPATWYTIMKMNFPFDRHTLFGYFWYLGQNYFYVNLYLFGLTVYTQFFIGTCMYLRAFCQDFESGFEKIGKATPNGDDHVKFTPKFEEQLCDVIQLHVDILDYFDQMTDILNGFVFTNMAGGALFMAISIQQLDSGIEQIDLNFFNSLITTVLCVCVSLPFCYLSSNAVANLKAIDKITYNAVWYTFPTKYQLYIKLLLIPSEHSKEFTGFGIINCSLETFKKMLNTSFSMYLMLKSTENRQT